MQTLLLNKNQVRRLIDLKQVIGAVEDAYKAYSSNQVEQPDYIGISLPARRGEIDFKLGYHKQAEIISMKAHSGDLPEILRSMAYRTAWGQFSFSMPGAVH